MTYGELINKKEKVVVVFKNSSDNINPESLLGFEEENCLCFAVEIDKNFDLCRSLKISKTPEYFFYHHGQLVLRNKSGMFFSIN